MTEIKIEEGVQVEYTVYYGDRAVRVTAEVAGPVEYVEHPVGSSQAFGIYVPVTSVHYDGVPGSDTRVLVSKIEAVRTKEDS